MVFAVFRLMKGYFSIVFLQYYILIIALTSIILYFNLDWAYHIWITSHTPRSILFIGDLLGFILPPLFIIAAYFYNYKRFNRFSFELYRRVFSSILLAISATTLVKIFTNRVGPPFRGDSALWVNDSMNFHFGFMEQSFIGGYPSSHAAVFFTLFFIFYFWSFKFKFKSIITLTLFVLASFISFSVSLGFHWISDVVAGIIFGYVTGRIVNTSKIKNL